MKENSNFVTGRILSAKRTGNRFYTGSIEQFKTQIQCEILDETLTQFTLSIEDTKLEPDDIEGRIFIGLVKQWRPKKIIVDDSTLKPLRLSNNNRTPFVLLSNEEYTGNLQALKESSATSHASENHCQYDSLSEAKNGAMVCDPGVVE